MKKLRIYDNTSEEIITISKCLEYPLIDDIVSFVTPDSKTFRCLVVDRIMYLNGPEEGIVDIKCQVLSIDGEYMT